jgi:hypothetical protein
MKRVISETNMDPASADRLAGELEQECETWNWARTAGLSAQDLRTALRESLVGGAGTASPAR